MNISEETISNLIKEFHSNKTQQQIMTEFKVSYDCLIAVWKDYYDEEEFRNRKIVNYSKSKLGKLNPRYGKPATRKKDFVSDGKGYQIESRPSWFMGRKGSMHIFKHHLVMCEALGLTELPKGFVVHHIDGNKLNNKLNNLALLTVSAHGRLHCRERRLTKK